MAQKGFNKASGAGGVKILRGKPYSTPVPSPGLSRLFMGSYPGEIRPSWIPSGAPAEQFHGINFASHWHEFHKAGGAGWVKISQGKDLGIENWDRKNIDLEKGIEEDEGSRKAVLQNGQNLGSL